MVIMASWPHRTLDASAFEPRCTLRNPDPHPLPPGPQALAFQNHHSRQNQRRKLLGAAACRPAGFWRNFTATSLRDPSRLTISMSRSM
jgi:hypothetical protein